MTFRARIDGTANTTSSELIGYIEQWIDEDVTIHVQNVTLTIDSTCYPVVIRSFADPNCESGNPSQEAHSDNTGAIIGGGVVAAVLIVAITIVVIAILVLKKHRGQTIPHRGG